MLFGYRLGLGHVEPSVRAKFAFTWKYLHRWRYIAVREGMLLLAFDPDDYPAFGLFAAKVASFVPSEVAMIRRRSGRLSKKGGYQSIGRLLLLTVMVPLR